MGVSEGVPADVVRAAEHLREVVNHTPVMTSRTLDQRAGCRVFLKCENFQRVGAFKFRGAFNAISRLNDTQKQTGVITHSSGNHAQGVALAASLLNVPAVVVMPHDAPEIKQIATQNYGARVVPCAAVDRELVTERLVKEHGYHLIHPYDNYDIIAGQGTAAWELLDQVDGLDHLFVPVGGGGLISGSALAVAAQGGSCRVVGVEPENAADANQSWRSGEIVVLETVPETIADGLRTRFVGRRNLPIMRRYVDSMITVSEAEIVRTLKFVWQRLKIIIEPSAATVLAPLLFGRYASTATRSGVILSGGNVDPFALRLPDVD